MCFLKIHTCALSSNVILFGDGAFGMLLGLDEVIRVELIPYKKREKQKCPLFLAYEARAR